MTGDELAARIYEEQGYLVVEHHTKWDPREVFMPSGTFTTNIPMKIVGKATKREYVKQIKRASAIVGLSFDIRPGPYFYRCEAAD